MLTTYGRVLARPGALAFSSSALLARLPIAMIGLGIVLLIQSQTGSYGEAGAVSAVYVLSGAAAALVAGRLVDRFGQSLVIAVLATLNATFLSLLIISVESGWPMAGTYVFAALTGLCMPPIGASVRARWSHNVREPRDLQTAFALEAVLDEVAFIVGPVLVTVLATTWHPWAGLTVALATGVLGSWLYASQRATAPPPGGRVVAADRNPMPWGLLVPIMVVCICIGMLFGAAEVITVAFSQEHGRPSAAGLLLACWSGGSLIAGVVTGAIQWRVSPATRIRRGALAMAITMAPLALIDSMALMAVVLLVGGLAIAPTLIATMSAVEQGVPRSRLTEGMAFVNTGMVAGIAPGAALAGLMIDHHGASAAYLVPLGAGLVGALAAQLVRGNYRPEHAS